MPESIQITCVKKSSQGGAHQLIEQLGCFRLGKRWTFSATEAIEGIEKRRWSFWIKAQGTALDIIVATDPSGAKYLKTAQDTGNVQNVLTLPECRA